MDENTVKPDVRRFATQRKRAPKNFIEMMRDSSGFLMTMGLLILISGLLIAIPFRNLFSAFMLATGFTLFFTGLAIKLFDICAKIIGER